MLWSLHGRCEGCQLMARLVPDLIAKIGIYCRNTVVSRSISPWIEVQCACPSGRPKNTHADPVCGISLIFNSFPWQRASKSIYIPYPIPVFGYLNKQYLSLCLAFCWETLEINGCSILVVPLFIVDVRYFKSTFSREWHFREILPCTWLTSKLIKKINNLIRNKPESPTIWLHDGSQECIANHRTCEPC